MPAQHLVLLGGGHAHIEVLRRLGQQRRSRQPAPQHHGQPPASQQQQQQQAQQQPACPAPQQQAQPHGPPASPAGSGSGAAVGGAQTAPVAGSAPQHTRHHHQHSQQRHTQQQQQQQQEQRTQPQPQPRVTLVSRGRFTPYSGMLPGWAAGHYSYGQCHVDLAALAAHAGAELREAEATGLDATARRVLFRDGSLPLPYDVLSVDIGITPGRAAVRGAEDARAVTPVKPIDGFAARYERLLERYRAAASAAAATLSDGEARSDAAGGAADGPHGAEAEPLIRVVVVGGGAGGVELAAAVRYRLEAERRAGGWPEACGRAAVSVVCRGGLLPGHPPHVRRLVGRLLAERRVGVVAGEAVSVSPGELVLASGARLPYDECLWCTAASPAPWLRHSGLPTDAQGFLSINEQLQSDGGPTEVFAAGDVASCATHPRPKAGVYAVRQGPPLAANLMAFLEGRPLQRFVPQATALALISLGDRFCVASRTGAPLNPSAATQPAAGAGATGSGGDGGSDCGDGPEWPLGWLLNGCGGAAAWLAGPLLWRWKDAIDRGFMRRYGEALGD